MGVEFTGGTLFMADGTKLMDLTDVTTVAPEVEQHKPISFNTEISGTFTFDSPCTKRGLIRLHRALLGNLLPKELGRRRQIKKVMRMMRCSFSK